MTGAWECRGNDRSRHRAGASPVTARRAHCAAGVQYSQSLVASLSTCSTKRAKRQHFSGSSSVRGLWKTQFSQVLSLPVFIAAPFASPCNGKRPSRQRKSARGVRP